MKKTTNENYYKDMAVFAYSSPVGKVIWTNTVKPKITSIILRTVMAGILIESTDVSAKVFT